MIKKLLASMSIVTILGLGILARTSFAANYTVSTSIPDNAIMIHVLSPTSATVTWTTSNPTTSTLIYNEDTNQDSDDAIQYSNASDGYTTFHTVTVSNIDLTLQHSFTVDGLMQGSNVMVTSGGQAL